MNTKISLNGQLSTGVVTKLITVGDASKIELCEIPSATFASGSNTIQIKHEKEGYNSYLLYCPQYGIADGLFCYVKDAGVNTAELYVQNRKETDVTASIGTTIWLCLPVLTDSENS